MGGFIFKAIGYFALIYVLAAICQYVIFPLSESRCKARWLPSHLDAAWTFGGGCVVNVNGAGQWVPEANVQISPGRN